MRDDDYDHVATPSEAVAEWQCNASSANPDECRCHGSGWMLHDWDVWVTCPYHNHGQPHPESYDWDG